MVAALVLPQRDHDACDRELRRLGDCHHFIHGRHVHRFEIRPRKPCGVHAHHKLFGGRRVGQLRDGICMFAHSHARNRMMVRGARVRAGHSVVGRQLKLESVRAVPCSGECATTCVEAANRCCIAALQGQRGGSSQRRMAAEVDFLGRREPSEKEALRLGEAARCVGGCHERRLAELHLGSDLLHDAVTDAPHRTAAPRALIQTAAAALGVHGSVQRRRDEEHGCGIAPERPICERIYLDKA